MTTASRRHRLQSCVLWGRRTPEHWSTREHFKQWMQLLDLLVIFFTGWFRRWNINDGSELLFYESDGLKGSKTVWMCVSYVISCFVRDRLFFRMGIIGWACSLQSLLFIWLYQQLWSNMKKKPLPAVNLILMPNIRLLLIHFRFGNP